jgi:hypothetical protein
MPMKRTFTRCLFTVEEEKEKISEVGVPSEQTLDFIRRFARTYKPGSEEGIGHFLFEEDKGYHFADIFHVMEV